MCLLKVTPGIMGRGQRPVCGSWLLPSTMWVLKSDSGPQAWWQAPLPPGHLASPLLVFWGCSLLSHRPVWIFLVHRGESKFSPQFHSTLFGVSQAGLFQSLPISLPRFSFLSLPSPLPSFLFLLAFWQRVFSPLFFFTLKAIFLVILTFFQLGVTFLSRASNYGLLKNYMN